MFRSNLSVLSVYSYLFLWITFKLKWMEKKLYQNLIKNLYLATFNKTNQHFPQTTTSMKNF